jgi:hypothetical protein
VRLTAMRKQQVHEQQVHERVGNCTRGLVSVWKERRLQTRQTHKPTEGRQVPRLSLSLPPPLSPPLASTYHPSPSPAPPFLPPSL